MATIEQKKALALAAARRRREEAQGQPKQNFLERTGSDLVQRGLNIGEAYNATDFGMTPEQGKQSIAELGLQTGGQIIGGAGDILGNLLTSGYKEFAPENVQNAVSSGLERFGQSDTGQYLGGLMEDYGQWAQENPRAARNVGALGNIASVLPYGKATSAAGTSLKQTANTLKRNIDDVIKQADRFDANMLKQAGEEAYKAADSVGAAIRPDAMSNYAKDITSIADIKTSIGKEAAETAGKATGMKQLQKAKDIINNMAGRNQKPTVSEMLSGKVQSGSISLSAFNDVDQTLSEMLYSKGSKLLNDKGSLNRAGKAVKGMQEALRDKVLNASSADIIGDKSAFETLKKAREFWHKQIKVRNIEDLIKGASMTQQPTTSLKTGFANILKNPKKRALYNAEELAAIERAANVGKVQEILNLFGSRLPSSISTGTGDFVTGAALRAGSELPRNMATNAQLMKAQDVVNTIAGVPKEKAAINMTRGALQTGANLPANALGALGTGLKWHAPQAAALGLLGNLQQ